MQIWLSCEIVKINFSLFFLFQLPAGAVSIFGGSDSLLKAAILKTKKDDDLVKLNDLIDICCFFKYLVLRTSFKPLKLIHC